MFATIGLIAKRDDPRVIEAVARLVRHLRGRGTAVVADAESIPAGADGALDRAPRERLAGACDLVVVIGGDGTFLGAARSLTGADVPVVGVNLGRLGFLADIMAGEMLERLDEILDGRFTEERRPLLRTEASRERSVFAASTAVNEIVVHKWHAARLTEFETFIDDHLVSRQRCDGLIVATPTGSTAYALSGGGPILHPALPATVLVPICPHTLSSRPIVVESSARIEIRVGAGERPEAILTADGHEVVALAPGDRVTVAADGGTLRLVHPPGHDYYATLRAKLHWGRAPS